MSSQDRSAERAAAKVSRPGMPHDASKKQSGAWPGAGGIDLGRQVRRQDGKQVAPLRVALPFQTVETVNESAPGAADAGLSVQRRAREKTWRNRLIWGDKKYVLPSLLPEFAGKVNLIYIDPPFDTGADFSFTATVPEIRRRGGR